MAESMIYSDRYWGTRTTLILITTIAPLAPVISVHILVVGTDHVNYGPARQKIQAL
jgi:hypothetical protein